MSEQKKENLLKVLKAWQHIEDEAVKSTTEIIRNTTNPLVQIVMEIIRQDSVMHRRVQQLIVDSFEKYDLSMSKEELDEFWHLIEEHDEMEHKVIELAKEAKKETNNEYIDYLLEYLLHDEEKHDKLLETLTKLKNK